MFFQSGLQPDLLATSTDSLRIWRPTEVDVQLECVLNPVSIEKLKPPLKRMFIPKLLLLLLE